MAPHSLDRELRGDRLSRILLKFDPIADVDLAVGIEDLHGGCIAVHGDDNAGAEHVPLVARSRVIGAEETHPRSPLHTFAFSKVYLHDVTLADRVQQIRRDDNLARSLS